MLRDLFPFFPHPSLPSNSLLWRQSCCLIHEGNSPSLYVWIQWNLKREKKEKNRTEIWDSPSAVRWRQSVDTTSLCKVCLLQPWEPSCLKEWISTRTLYPKGLSSSSWEILEIESLTGCEHSAESTAGWASQPHKAAPSEDSDLIITTVTTTTVKRKWETFLLFPTMEVEAEENDLAGKEEKSQSQSLSTTAKHCNKLLVC